MTPNNQVAFIETSVVREKLFGHSRIKENIKKELDSYQLCTSFFVWMEFKRGLVRNFIEFYFNLKYRHETVQDAITWWSHDYAPRKLKDIYVDITHWLAESGVSNNKELALIKLKEQILRIYCSFELLFPKRNFVDNKTGCKLSKINLSGIKDEDLKKFYKTFENKLLANKCNIKNFLAINKSKIEKIKKVNKTTTDGFKRQVKNMTSLNIVNFSCKDCERIGDTIIALECPKNQKLFSMDKAFKELCSLLDSVVTRL